MDGLVIKTHGGSGGGGGGVLPGDPGVKRARWRMKTASLRSDASACRWTQLREVTAVSMHSWWCLQRNAQTFSWFRMQCIAIGTGWGAGPRAASTLIQQVWCEELH